MKKYLAVDGINGDYESFETIAEAREYLEESFFDKSEGYHPDYDSCEIYELKEVVQVDVVDRRENYKYLNEEDIPDGDESEAWPYNNNFEEIWQHKFVDVSKNELKNYPL